MTTNRQRQADEMADLRKRLQDAEDDAQYLDDTLLEAAWILATHFGWAETE